MDLVHAPAEPGPARPTWPAWARVGASAAIGLHLLAIGAALLAAPPASGLEREVAQALAPYHVAMFQEHAYRFYAPYPPPTPVLRAELRFEDGRSEEVRIPDRSLGPRLRYQRHLALAHHLFGEFKGAEAASQASLWGRSYARHLCRTHPGCVGVTLRAQLHLSRDPEHLREHPEAAEAEEAYSTPELVGDYPCKDL